MKRLTLTLCAAALTGCVVVPIDTAMTACETLVIAQHEADMAPHWYISAGEVLTACGHPNAKADAERRACAANKRNGYRCDIDDEVAP